MKKINYSIVLFALSILMITNLANANVEIGFHSFYASKSGELIDSIKANPIYKESNLIIPKSGYGFDVYVDILPMFKVGGESTYMPGFEYKDSTSFHQVVNFMPVLAAIKFMPVDFIYTQAGAGYAVKFSSTKVNDVKQEVAGTINPTGSPMAMIGAGVRFGGPSLGNWTISSLPINLEVGGKYYKHLNNPKLNIATFNIGVNVSI